MQNHGRLAILVLAFVCATGLVVTLDAGSLQAGPTTPVDADIRNALASKEAKRSLQRYAEKIATIARAADDDELLNDALPKSMRKRNIRPFVIDAAVGDGKVVFARTTRSVSFLEVVINFGALPVEVIERDVASGTERLLFKSRAATVGGLRTRAGSTVFGTAKIAAGRRSLSYDTSLLVARPGSSGATVVRSESMKLQVGKFTFCGSIIGSTTIDQSGALLLSRVTGTCALVNEVKTERSLINPDGSERAISFGATMPALNDSILNYENGRLLSLDSDTSTVGLSDEQSPLFTPLINGEVSTASLAADGSVAAAVRNNVTAFPNQSAYPSPLIVFPQGDPDRMVVASRMAGKVRHVQFCADRLYVVKRVSNIDRDFDWPNIGVTFNWMTRSSAKYRVLVYDRNGALIKSLGDTPKMVLAAVGCEAGALNLLATRGKNSTLLRYAP